jgi:hypothetical protein
MAAIAAVSQSIVPSRKAAWGTHFGVGGCCRLANAGATKLLNPAGIEK